MIPPFVWARYGCRLLPQSRLFFTRRKLTSTSPSPRSRISMIFAVQNRGLGPTVKPTIDPTFGIFVVESRTVDRFLPDKIGLTYRSLNHIGLPSLAIS